VAGIIAHRIERDAGGLTQGDHEGIKTGISRPSTSVPI
jgi:hypothetical protein